MTYLQLTARKYFTKWSMVKNTVSHLNFPQAVGRILSLFQGEIFLDSVIELCEQWGIIHEQKRLPLSYFS